MTAPGDDVLTLLLLALFLVSTGYAAGRLHQWYRMGTDRDEAYRDGYDTATRSVFSMAVRLIGPRRPVRATATVIPGTVTTPLRGPAAVTSDAPTAGTAVTVGAPSAVIPGSPAAASSPGRTGADAARHSDELMRAPTHRLTPATIARAATREPDAPPAPNEDATRAIPRPRTP